MRWRKNIQKGQSLVEILIAVAIFAIFGLGVATLVLDSLLTTSGGQEESFALFLAQEGLDATRSIRDESWKNLVNGTYGLDGTGASWVFSGSSDVTDGTYTREITIEDVLRNSSGNIVLSSGTVDPRTKLVTSTVSYDPIYGIARTVTLQAYLIDWNVFDFFETNDSDFDDGTFNDTERYLSGASAVVRLEEGDGPSGPSGPPVWQKGGGQTFLDTTDSHFNAGTLTDLIITDTGDDAYLSLESEIKWDLFDFPFGTVDMNYSGAQWAVGDDGKSFQWLGSTWVEVPTTTSEDLYHLYQVSASEVFAVGKDGATIRWNGSVWEDVPNASTQDLYAVSMISTYDGFAGGKQGELLRWNGSAWVVQTSPTSRDIESIFMYDENFGVAVGASGEIMHWNGTSWSVQSSPTGKRLMEVWVVSPTDTWASGQNGALVRWNGVSWSNFSSPTTDRLDSLSMVTTDNGFVGADNGRIFQFDGATWNEVLSPTNNHLQSIYMISATDGWAVGVDGTVLRWNGSFWVTYTQNISSDKYNDVDFSGTDFAFAVGEGGAVMRWDGGTWSETLTPTNKKINSVDILSAVDGWMVGNNGEIHQWDGSSWSSVTSPTGNELHGVSMVSASEGYIVGYNDTMLIYNGSTWSTIAAPGNRDWSDVSMLNSSDGFAVSTDNGAIARWNGSSWSNESSPTNDQLYSVDYFSASFAVAVGESGTIIHWNGTSWSDVTTPTSKDLNSVSIFSDSDAIAAGENGTLVKWDGVSWTSLSSPTNNELLGSTMLATNNAWAVGEDGTIVHLANFPKTTGNIESRIFDSSSISTTWDIVHWTENNYSVTDVVIETRTGNTATPDGSWSSWSSTLTDPDGSLITSPNGQYLQYKATLTTSDIAVSPDLLDITIVYNDPNAVNDVNAIDMISENDGWAVGNSGVIYRYDGSKWVTTATPTGDDLFGVSQISSSDAWAVGESGRIIQYNGTNWVIYSGTPTLDLYAIDMVSASDGWMVGNSGTIYQYDGVDWNAVSSPSAQNLRGVSVVSASDVWAVGDNGTIIRWNGVLWATVTSPVTEDLYSIDMVSATDGWAVGESGKMVHWNGSAWIDFEDRGTEIIHSVSMLDEDTGYAVADGGLILRFDGVAWLIDVSPIDDDLYGVKTNASTDAWAVGAGGIFVHLTPSGSGSGGGTPVTGSFIDDEQSEFDSGTYTSNTEWDTDHVQMTSGQTSGTFTSRIFDSGDASSSWSEISWTESFPSYGFLMEVGTVVAPAGSAGGGPGQLIDDTQGEFNTGTYSGTQWDTDHVELDATGQSGGTGTYTSEVFNVSSSASWDTISWVPDAPYGKELPDSAATETAYTNGNADMTSNVLLFHMNESSGTITDSSGNSNNGTQSGGVSYSQTAKLNTGLGFDSVDDIVTVADSASLDLTDTVTIEGWFNVTNVATSGGGAPGSIVTPAVDSLEFDTGAALYTEILPISGNIYAIAYQGPGSDGWVKTVEIDSSGVISNSTIDQLEFDTSAGIETSFIHVTGDVYAVAYRGSGNDGFVTTFTIDSAGNIGNSTIDTLEFDTANGYHPNIIHVTGDYYAIAYRGTGSDGFIATVDIDSAGNISNSVVDVLEYDTSAGNWPDLIQLSTNYYAIAYQGPGNDGWIKTVNIDNSGNISNSVVDSYEFDASEGREPDIINLSGNVFAIVYRDTDDDGQLVTVTIDTVGNITNSIIDSFEFDTADAFSPVITNMAGNYYAIAYESVDSDGFLKTVEILSTGLITSPVIDTFEFNATQGEWPSVYMINSNYLAIAYRGPGNDGFVTTIEISTSSSSLKGGVVKSGAYALEMDTGTVYATINSTEISSSISSGWNHLAMTYDRNAGSNQIQLYVNGSSVAQGTSTATITNNANNVIIGENLEATLDEIAVYNEALTSTEVADHYKRGVLRIKHQLRSCDDAACSGESFVGPDGTGTDYYWELDNSAIALPTFSITNIIDNQYFQYQTTFETDDTSLTPELNSLTIDYTTSSTDPVVFTTVNLAQTYVSPVIIPLYLESNNTESVSVRVDNVTTTSFDVALQDASGAATSSDTIHYMVVEEGAWVMPDGTLIEASTLDTSTVGYKNNWNAVSQSYTNTYSSSPAVFHSIQTYNDSNWIETWVSDDGSRTAPPDTAGFQIGLNGAEAVTSHLSETIGWVAIETGTGTIAGLDYEVSITSDSVQGHDDGCDTFSFSNSYASLPIIISDQQEMDGNDGGWGVACSLSTTQIGVHTEEDQESDTERNHTSETFAFAAFESSFSYALSSDLTFQVRSCDDAACSGEIFVGPDGTAGTYFTIYTGETIDVSNNQYVQYQATFTSNHGSYSPELSMVQIDYTTIVGGGSGTYPASGTYLSHIINSDSSSTVWQTIYWNEVLPSGTNATVAFRSGDTATPDGSWNSFTSEFTDTAGGLINQTGQYGQYRVTFTTTDTEATPQVEDVTVTYK